MALAKRIYARVLHLHAFSGSMYKEKPFAMTCEILIQHLYNEIAGSVLLCLLTCKAWYFDIGFLLIIVNEMPCVILLCLECSH